MIGQRIHQIRHEKGLSLSMLAERAEIAKSYLSNLERDIQKNPSIQVLDRIAAVLRVPVDRLLDQEEGHGDENMMIDREWVQLVKEAMNSGIDKNQFREFLEFNKWRLNQPS